MIERSDGQPGLFDLIAEKEKCEKRSGEISTLLYNEYDKILCSTFRESWRKFYKDYPESGGIESYGVSTSAKILIAFRPFYECTMADHISVEFSLAPFIMKDGERLKEEVFEALTKRQNAFNKEKELKAQEREKQEEEKELKEFERLKEKFKQRDLI